MAATVTVTSQRHSNGAFRSNGSLTLGTYVTGGVAVTPNQFKLGAGDFDLQLQPTAGVFFEYDKTNKKIKAFYPIQMVHNASPSAQAVSVTAADTGLEAAFGATANFAGAEALNSADLSGLTVRFIALGAY